MIPSHSSQGFEVMDNEYQKLVSNTSNKIVTSQTNNTSQSQYQQHKKQDKLSRQGQNENINLQRTISTTTGTSPPSPSPPSKVTVTLPEHAASRLRDLVQKKDIALIRLGIISVQFENDQIIPLTLDTNVKHESIQPKQQSTIAPEPIIESPLGACNTDYFGDLNTITTLFDLASPDSPIFEESSLNAFESPILDPSIANGLPERLEI